MRSVDSVRRIGVVGLLAVALAAGVALLVAVWPVLIPFALALVVAYLVAPVVDLLERRGMRRSTAILTLYAAMTVLVLALVFRVLPGAYGELLRLAESVPAYAERLRRFLALVQTRFQSPGIPPGVRQGIEAALAATEQQANRVLAAAVGNLFDYLGWLGSVLLAPFLAYYLLRDQDRMKRAFTRSLPRRWRVPTLEWLAQVDRVIGGFVRGQLVLAGVVGVLATLAAGLLGLRFAVLLGLWAALAELVPYVGPVVGAVPAVISGFLISPLRGLQVTLAFVLIQQLENAVLGPRVLGETVGLHPLVVFFAILAGGYLAGIPGMLLAVPVAGILRVTGRVLHRHLTLPPQVPGSS